MKARAARPRPNVPDPAGGDAASAQAPSDGAPKASRPARSLSAWSTLAVAVSGTLLVLAARLWSVSPWPALAPKPDYLGTGTVVELLPPPSSLHPNRPVIIIHHDPLPGLMEEAMAMPFLAASTDLFQDLRPGDRIAFGLKETPDALLVISLQRLGR